ncbi:MAG: hypothetical protein HC917_01545 [Richelia sp. SM2_1_7]|nr:hypothetical protein [Richelia sp. SM2_1_7]
MYSVWVDIFNTTMQLVEKHVINKSHKYWLECDQLCLDSNKIRNQGLYIQRQSWFYGHGVIKFGKTELHKNIDALMKQTACYHNLPAFLAQQVMKSVNEEWTSFFNAIKQWKLDKSGFSGRPKPPKYKPRNTGRYKVTYPQTRAYKKAKINGIIHPYKTDIRIQSKYNKNYTNEISENCLECSDRVYGEVRYAFGIKRELIAVWFWGICDMPLALSGSLSGFGGCAILRRSGL